MGADPRNESSTIQRQPAAADRAPLLPLRVGRVCDVGLVRDNNEDALAVSVLPASEARVEQIRGVLAVADGMGGHSYGGMASRIAVETILERMKPGLEPGPGEARLAGLAVEAVRQANDAIRASAKSLGGAGSAAMGTTLSAVAVVGNTIAVAHVGDSRVYLIRKGEIFQLTIDHTWVEEQIREGKLTPEAAAAHSMRHYLTRSLGAEADIDVDVHFGRRLQNADVLVLCSDGLTIHVEADEIVGCVHATDTPQAAAEKMLALAKRRGGSDNTTIVVAEVGVLRRRRALARRITAPNWIPIAAAIGLGAVLVGAGTAAWMLWPFEPEKPRRSVTPPKQRTAPSTGVSPTGQTPGQTATPRDAIPGLPPDERPVRARTAPVTQTPALTKAAPSRTTAPLTPRPSAVPSRDTRSLADDVQASEPPTPKAPPPVRGQIGDVPAPQTEGGKQYPPTATRP